jgi:aerobic-type carbon monoxide dehydrogenase small subunit (CoxS/CutS family)
MPRNRLAADVFLDGEPIESILSSLFSVRERNEKDISTIESKARQRPRLSVPYGDEKRP